MDSAVVQDVSAALTRIGEEVQRNGFAFRAGKDMRSIMRERGLDNWSSFASSWERLGLDLYMADGGRYRRRRFAAFDVSAKTIVRKPHQPHYQSRDYNPLNGGIERWFEPVTDAVATHDFMQSLLGICSRVFDDIRPTPADLPPWHVEVHQFRIEAAVEQSGRPTPEGPHRDGADWVCVMLVNRRNVSSGITQIYDCEGRSLGQFTLTDPLDAIFVDDTRVLHGVTPINRLDPGLKASRDVLVLTFRRGAVLALRRQP